MKFLVLGFNFCVSGEVRGLRFKTFFPFLLPGWCRYAMGGGRLLLRSTYADFDPSVPKI